MNRTMVTAVFVFLGIAWLGVAEGIMVEVPCLDELKKSCLLNNLSLKIKQEELRLSQAKESILNHIRLSSSYNFETQSQFYGVTASFPFDFFGNKARYLRFNQLVLEQAKQCLLFELEDLYLKYQAKSRDILVYEMNFKKQELRYRSAKIGFKHHRINQEELLSQELELRKQEAELVKLRQELESLEGRLYEFAGIKR